MNKGIHYLFILFFLFPLCSCVHEYTDIADLFSHVDKMVNVSKDTEVYWDMRSLPPPSPWADARTIGALEQLLKEGNKPNEPMKGDGLERLPIDALVWAPVNADKTQLSSRLAAIHLLLKYGAPPQRMSSQFGTSEEEYALFIMHGLKATAPVVYGGNPQEIQYPLTRRTDFITYPIAKWLLENGADPNQHAISPHNSRREDPITPLRNIHSKRPVLYAEATDNMRAYRSKERVERVHKLLIEYGAKDNTEISGKKRNCRNE